MVGVESRSMMMKIATRQHGKQAKKTTPENNRTTASKLYQRRSNGAIHKEWLWS
jgi:hypothetical protein